MQTATAVLVLVLLLPVFTCAQPGRQDTATSEAYLKYVQPTIGGPLPDILMLGAPAELEDQRLAKMGYVDVTKGPFRADPTGQDDCTAALQEAINFARDHQLVCFFPPGTYRISDTLECIQQLYQRTNGRVFGGNRFPNMLVGSRRGARRPQILLAPSSPGFSDPARPKYVVHFWARGYLNPTTADRVSDGLGPESEQPNISMNQMLVGVDITVGEGNGGAIALRHQAAEGSAIEDCTIDVTHGFVGIQGGIGSGGSSANVTVIGGRIGLDFTGYLSGTQPTPAITGFTLRGQTETAIRSTSRQALVAAGLRIVSDGCAGPLITVPSNLSANTGELSLVDSVLEFSDAARAAYPTRIGVSSESGVYLNNVYVRNATLVTTDGARRTSLPGNPGGWVHVKEYAHSAVPRTNQGIELSYPVYVDGKSVQDVRDVETDATPPADLQSRHLWRADFPTFEAPGAANVKDAPYAAKGDGVSDDTAALQRAIDESEIVFLPRGCYRTSQPLELKPRTKLIGVGQHLSLIMPLPTGAFADAAKPAPLVRTADTADADCIVAFVGLYAASDVPGATALHWRCGGTSVFRGAEIDSLSTHGFAPAPRGQEPPARRTAPFTTVSGHGGGNWYNYRGARIVVDGAQGPLHFYQFSPQQVTNELRGARNVDIYATKFEGSRPMLVVTDCDHIRLFGHGGNGKALAGESLFVFERTPNFLFANGVDGPTRIGSQGLSSPQGSTDPRLWHMLIERFADGTEFKLPPCERPVLYRRGTP